MNYISFDHVASLFLEKHPRGSIYQVSNNKCNIEYEEGKKVYNYTYKNHIDLLEKLKLNSKKVMYKHNYDALLEQIARLENEIEKGCINDDFLGVGEYKFSEVEIEEKKKELHFYKDTIKNVVIVWEPEKVLFLCRDMVYKKIS